MGDIGQKRLSQKTQFITRVMENSKLDVRNYDWFQIFREGLSDNDWK